MSSKPKQCKLCPWRKDVDPRSIPNGYCESGHKNLSRTVRSGVTSLVGPLRVMACHESPLRKPRVCIGWLAHQLGPGNNIALRLAVRDGRYPGDFELVGEQHERFEDTLPAPPTVTCARCGERFTGFLAYGSPTCGKCIDRALGSKVES